MEFFGDEIESIRAFDVDSQLSFRKLEEADMLVDEPESADTLEGLIDSDDWVVSLPGCGVPGMCWCLRSHRTARTCCRRTSTDSTRETEQPFRVAARLFRER